MFIKINKKIEYALIALNHLYEQANGTSVTSRELSERYKLPFDTISKVMQSLAAHEILISTQGVKGGYQLKTNLSQINYLNIYEIIEGKKVTTDCKDMACKLVSTCNITGPISNLNHSLVSYMQGLSLADLFENRTPETVLREVIHG
ncbi:MAG: hypothetical protein CME62_18270 [Halobacteriovoraceae bacterium]|nr:hypothetical protein [Halobacteriovoraceae bacterium]|tara:strand:+ start:11772 stop:12212 length:441 start_codon:yes stop_codon:yes gene_type:complete